MILKLKRISDPDWKNSSYSEMGDPTIRSVASLLIRIRSAEESCFVEWLHTYLCWDTILFLDAAVVVVVVTDLIRDNDHDVTEQHTTSSVNQCVTKYYLDISRPQKKSGDQIVHATKGLWWARMVAMAIWTIYQPVISGTALSTNKVANPPRPLLHMKKQPIL